MSHADNHGRISFGVRQLLVFVALCAFALGASSWLVRWPSVEISGPDIANETVIEIAAWTDPTSLHIHLYGNLIGQATITDPWGSTTTIGPGEFNEIADGDYYEKTATIRYSPVNVNTGNLTVRYNFDHF